MKKLFVVLALLLVAGCNEEICRPTGWLMGGSGLGSDQATYTGRVGIATKDGLEGGLESSWIGKRAENQFYGVYFCQFVELVDVGQQYIGAHASIFSPEKDYDGGFYGLIAGEALTLSKNIVAITEYQFNGYDDDLKDLQQTDDAHKVTAGVRIGF